MNLLCDLRVWGFSWFLGLVFFFAFLNLLIYLRSFCVIKLILKFKKQIKRVGFLKILNFAAMLNIVKAL